MSNPHLPAETLDHIVDYLCDKKDALRNCCLVSNSWIPRSRKHLFADIVFASSESLQLWKETFPDPSTSPACYAKTLFIGCAQVVTVVDAEAGGWIRGFSRVVHLVVRSQALLASKSFSFVPFHGLSPAIKSIRVSVPAVPSSRIIDLILSFPLLEDLAVTTYPTMLADADDDYRLSPAVLPSSSPMFTGTLELFLGGGLKSFACWLLSLPGGIPFRKFTMTCFRASDLVLAMPLIERCSHTLESLDIACSLHCKSGSTPIDLSKTTKLKDVAFRPEMQRIEWVVVALRTITPKHRDLRQITIHMPRGLTHTRLDAGGGQWSDIDRLLVQFWESRLIRPKVVCPMVQDVRDLVGWLLPEITKRGLIDLVEHVLM